MKNKNKKTHKKNIIRNIFLILILTIVFYLVLVWFFPVLDFTGGVVNKCFDELALLLGINKPVAEVKDEYFPIEIENYIDKDIAFSDNYAIYFSQTHNGNLNKAREDEHSIDRMLSSYIKNAKDEINIVMHDLNSDKITSALIYAFKNGVDVRMVVEEKYKARKSVKYLMDSGVPIKLDENKDLMHNKFLIIDNKFVWTGSFNATDRCSYYNDNNAIIFYSPQLAKYFNDEFKEMFYLGKFGPNSPKYKEPLPKIIINDKNAGLIEVEAHFAPDIDITKQILEALSTSKESIYFMAFSFTKEEIADMLISKHNKGIKIEGIFEFSQVDSYSKFDTLQKAGISVFKDKNKYNLHHKVFIIDKEIVITGSANFSNNAVKRNDENILIIKNKNIALTYFNEFMRIMERTKD
jgi:phosphatidylserine/phosphatidylglycerophosphate/cardiolipin synthase-like enzyme